MVFCNLIEGLQQPSNTNKIADKPYSQCSLLQRGGSSLKGIRKFYNRYREAQHDSEKLLQLNRNGNVFNNYFIEFLKTPTQHNKKKPQFINV